MKPLSGLDLLEKSISDCWIIREKIQSIGFGHEISLDDEAQFVEVKGRIARRIRALMALLDKDMESRDMLIRFLRKIPNLYQLTNLGIENLNVLEKECHLIYLELNKWYGENTRS